MVRVPAECNLLLTLIDWFAWSKISFKLFTQTFFCWLLTSLYCIYWISIHWYWNLSSVVIEKFLWPYPSLTYVLASPQGCGKSWLVWRFCSYTCHHQFIYRLQGNHIKVSLSSSVKHFSLVWELFIYKNHYWWWQFGGSIQLLVASSRFCWTRTPISVVIVTFSLPLSTYVLKANPYKRGTHHQLRQRHGDMDRLYFKMYYNWRIIGTSKCTKIGGVCEKEYLCFSMFKKLVFSCVSIFSVFNENKS